MKNIIFEKLKKIVQELEYYSENFFNRDPVDLESLYDPIANCMDRYKEVKNLAMKNDLVSDNEYINLKRQYENAMHNLYIRALIVINTD